MPIIANSPNLKKQFYISVYTRSQNWSNFSSSLTNYTKSIGVNLNFVSFARVVNVKYLSSKLPLYEKSFSFNIWFADIMNLSRYASTINVNSWLKIFCLVPSNSMFLKISVRKLAQCLNRALYTGLSYS